MRTVFLFFEEFFSLLMKIMLLKRSFYVLLLELELVLLSSLIKLNDDINLVVLWRKVNCILVMLFSLKISYVIFIKFQIKILFFLLFPIFVNLIFKASFFTQYFIYILF